MGIFEEVWKSEGAVMDTIDDFRDVLERRRKKECKGKVQYATPQQAAVARKVMERQHKGQIFTEYSCDFCARWHVGHSRYQKKRRRKN